MLQPGVFLADIFESDSFTVLIVADFPFAFAFLVPAFPFAFAFGLGAFFFAVVVAVACNFLAASSDARRCVFSVSFFNFFNVSYFP